MEKYKPKPSKRIANNAVIHYKLNYNNNNSNNNKVDDEAAVVWREYVTVAYLAETNNNKKKKQPRARSFFLNSKTNEKVWDEPPTGATNIHWATDEERKAVQRELKEKYGRKYADEMKVSLTTRNNMNKSSSSKKRRGSFESSVNSSNKLLAQEQDQQLLLLKTSSRLSLQSFKSNKKNSSQKKPLCRTFARDGMRVVKVVFDRPLSKEEILEVVKVVRAIKAEENKKARRLGVVDEGSAKPIILRYEQAERKSFVDRVKNKMEAAKVKLNVSSKNKNSNRLRRKGLTQQQTLNESIGNSSCSRSIYSVGGHSYASRSEFLGSVSDYNSFRSMSEFGDYESSSDYNNRSQHSMRSFEVPDIQRSLSNSYATDTNENDVWKGVMKDNQQSVKQQMTKYHYGINASEQVKESAKKFTIVKYPSLKPPSLLRNRSFHSLNSCGSKRFERSQSFNGLSESRKKKSHRDSSRLSSLTLQPSNRLSKRMEILQSRSFTHQSNEAFITDSFNKNGTWRADAEERDRKSLLFQKPRVSSLTNKVSRRTDLPTDIPKEINLFSFTDSNEVPESIEKDTDGWFIGTRIDLEDVGCDDCSDTPVVKGKSFKSVKKKGVEKPSKTEAPGIDWGFFTDILNKNHKDNRSRKVNCNPSFDTHAVRSSSRQSAFENKFKKGSNGKAEYQPDSSTSGVVCNEDVRNVAIKSHKEHASRSGTRLNEIPGKKSPKDYQSPTTKRTSKNVNDTLIHFHGRAHQEYDSNPPSDKAIPVDDSRTTIRLPSNPDHDNNSPSDKAKPRESPSFHRRVHPDQQRSLNRYYDGTNNVACLSTVIKDLDLISDCVEVSIVSEPVATNDSYAYSSKSGKRKKEHNGKKRTSTTKKTLIKNPSLQVEITFSNDEELQLPGDDRFGDIEDSSSTKGLYRGRRAQ